MNLTCNSTLEHLRSMYSPCDTLTSLLTNPPGLLVSPGSEIKLVGQLTFHDLARIIGAACTLIAVLLSLYLIFMHATHYTKPREQR